MLHLAERWGSPSSPLLLSHSEGGVIWLPRPSAVLVASWARDLASPLPSPLANCFRGALCRCGEGMLPFGYTVFLQSPLSLTVLSDNIYIIYIYIYIYFVSQIKSAATHFISYKVRASRQFIQVQNLNVITTKISYFRQTTQVNSNSA